MSSVLTTVVGSYPVPDWLAHCPSEQALVDGERPDGSRQVSAGTGIVDNPPVDGDLGEGVFEIDIVACRRRDDGHLGQG